MDSFECLRDCPNPGSCCKEFAVVIRGKILGYGKYYAKPEEITRLAKTAGFPFVAKRYSYHIDTWYFSCPVLGEDGLCTDYKNRPEICRNYKPKSDGLCCVKRTNKETIQLICQIFLNFFG